MKMQKFAIQDENERFLWGLASRSGVHFDNETMPKFWEINAKTKLFDSAEEADEFAINNDIKSWTNYKIVPISVTVSQ